MTHDTEWPASAPLTTDPLSRIEAERLVWCIRYLAEEARRSGFRVTATILEAVAAVEEGSFPDGIDKASIGAHYNSSN